MDIKTIRQAIQLLQDMVEQNEQSIVISDGAWSRIWFSGKIKGIEDAISEPEELLSRQGQPQ